MPLTMGEVFLCLGEDALPATFYPRTSLRSARGLACCSKMLASSFKVYIKSADFSVSSEDGTWDNAKYVASLGRETLRVEGELYTPVLQLARLRTLERFKVGDMGVVAGLFLGAAVGDCNCAVRLSDGITVRSFKPLRERQNIVLPAKRTIPNAVIPMNRVEGAEASPADYAVLLGALALNNHVHDKNVLWSAGGVRDTRRVMYQGLLDHPDLPQGSILWKAYQAALPELALQPDAGSAIDPGDESVPFDESNLGTPFDESSASLRARDPTSVINLYMQSELISNPFNGKVYVGAFPLSTPLEVVMEACMTVLPPSTPWVELYRDGDRLPPERTLLEVGPLHFCS